MKKMKVLVSTLLLGSLLTLGTTGVFAKAPDTQSKKQGDIKITSTYYNPPIEYDFQDASQTQKANAISPNYIPYTGDEYEYSTKSLYKAKSWGTTITNNSSTVDSVSRTVTRTTFATGTVGLQASAKYNFGLVEGTLQINGEVSWGTNTSVSVTYTWNIPARSTTTIATGSLAVQTIGNVVHYSNGVATNKQYVNCKYSYDDYADKTSKPL